MDDAAAVGEPDRLGDLLEHLDEPGQVGGRGLAVLEELGEGVAVDALHDEEVAAVAQGAEGVDRQDGRVREPGGDLRLGDEPIRFALPREERLDGDLAIEGEVVGRVNGPHPAPGDFAGDLVPGDMEDTGRDGAVGAGRAGLGPHERGVGGVGIAGPGRGAGGVEGRVGRHRRPFGVG